MKKGRRSHEEIARQRLLDLWCGEDSFGDPVGCVATTYTFQPDFFEEQCLARFLRMDTEAGEDGRAYLIEHETKLAQAFACVMVDDGQATGNRSLRWHLLPVRVPGAIQHAKISVLEWQDCVRILVGSANLTVPGYRSNFEHMAVLDFRPESGPPLAILHDVLGCIRSLQQMSIGAGQGSGPHRMLDRFIQVLEGKVRAWTGDAPRRGDPRCTFTWLGPDRPSLFSALAKLWSGPPANFARIVSPFFSGGTETRSATDALERDLLVSRGPCEIHFVAPGHRAPDGAVELNIPEELRHSSRNAVEHQFALVNDLPSEESQGRRALHAKSLWIERDGRVLFSLGSSNFTANGTGLAKSPNVEANMVYEIPEATTTFCKLCWAASPPSEAIDLEAQKVRFVYDAESTDEEVDTSEHAPLPECFGAALFELTDGQGVVRLNLVAEPPPGFTASSGGEVVLDGTRLAGLTYPREISCALPGNRPVSFLEVSWPSDGAVIHAIWVVNVADSRALPPPEEMQQLSLEELLQVLTSSSPLHITIARVLRLREKKATADSAPVADPHRKVDTSNYLLRRMRRFSVALEGLRERMQRHVYSLDALAWRLHGPLGPLALAQRVAAEEADAAGFMIAEVAATMADARPVAGSGMDKSEVDQALRAVVEELVRQARQCAAPANLASYIKDACREIMS